MRAYASRAALSSGGMWQRVGASGCRSV